MISTTSIAIVGCYTMHICIVGNTIAPKYWRNVKIVTLTQPFKISFTQKKDKITLQFNIFVKFEFLGKLRICTLKSDFD